jgi:coenzyme F420-reducing hydrogenase gamma subunit
MNKIGRLPDLKGLEILIGKRVKPSGKKTRTLAIGNCCKTIQDKVEYYVPGCPPRGILIGDSIKVSCGIEKEPTRYMRRWCELMKQIAS